VAHETIYKPSNIQGRVIPSNELGAGRVYVVTSPGGLTRRSSRSPTQVHWAFVYAGEGYQLARPSHNSLSKTKMGPGTRGRFAVLALMRPLLAWQCSEYRPRCCDACRGSRRCR
jgi:hypothetical protein